MVNGSKAEGIIRVEIEFDSPKVVSIALEPGGREENSGVPPPPINGTMASGEIERRLSDYFTKLAADDVFSGVALVARNGVPVFLKAYGFADREKKVANTIRTRFNIGSINKAFTKIATEQLIAEGKLSRTDTLGKFFQDYPQAATRAATIEQLLTHRAGVADFFGAQFNTAPKHQFASNAGRLHRMVERVAPRPSNH